MCYTYLIGWTKYNKWYYGVRYAKGCKPLELWNTYFTSSSYVKSFREKFGEPDVIQIRKIFNSKDKAILWENKVLNKMDVIHKDMWLNKTNNIAIRNGNNRIYGDPWNKGKSAPRTKESIEKQRIAMTGKKRGNYNIIEDDKRLALRLKMSEQKIGNQYAKGVKQTNEHKLKRSSSNIGIYWWTNNIIEVKNKICPPGFSRGRVKKH